MNIKELLKRAARVTPATEMAMERLNFYRRIEMAHFMRERRQVARRYLHGEGIEIGALHMRTGLPRGVRVRYVDRFDEHEAKRVYPEMRTNRLAPVDIVDDGETLDKIEMKSLDFIIANHMIEHCENPLRTIENWLGKLRTNGIIFLCVPDREWTFDRERPPTPPEHLLRDWREGSDWSRREHYEEFGRCVHHLTGSALCEYVERSLATHENIHFHAWSMKQFLPALLLFERELCDLRRVSNVFKLELCLSQNLGEFKVVLRKTE